MGQVAYFINSIDLSNWVTGTAQPKLNQTNMNKIQILFPPLNEQKIIVSKIESIFAQIDSTKESLESIKLLLRQCRQSVLKNAFEGKLVPQDPNDESAEILLENIHRDDSSKNELVFEKDNLPKRWLETKLENCIEILDNERIPINFSERKLRQGKIPYYGSTGQVGWIDDYLFDEELVLLGEDAAPFLNNFKDKAYLISGKSWVNNHAHVLRGIKDLLLNSFLCHFLNQFDYYGYVTGTTRLKLNQTSMKTIPVLLPPLSEQKRIVSKIESIFGRIDAEHNFAIFVTVFSYKTKSTCLHPICSSDLQLTPLQSQELISGYLKFHLQEFLALAGFLNHLMTRLLARICLVKFYLSLLYHHTNMI